MKIQEKSLILILKPIIKFLISKGFKYSQINELVQKALVEESVEQVKSVNQEVSVSKIALVSGVHRGRVKEILDSNHSLVDLQASTLARILGFWSSKKEYLDIEGMPRPLSIIGADSEFSKLVLSVTKQISPYTVLFELKRTQAVLVENDKVKLVIREYWTGHSADETYSLVSKNIDNLLSAVNQNLESQGQAINQLHLTTEYDNIQESKIPEIKKWLLTKGEDFHKEISSYLAMLDIDLNKELKEPGEAKVSITTFSFSSPKIKIQEIKPNKRGRKKKNV